MTYGALRKVVDAFDLTEHADRLDDRDRDASLGLLAMVIGAGNFGKSSLVNAICGKSIAPVSVIPKTFKIDVFTSGESNTASVRRFGQALPFHCSQEKARAIEAEEERRKGLEGEPPLAEIIWRCEGLELPHGISIVDTPGISQALKGSSRGVSLTKVLGNTFEVDEVWARWFHRADVVIWAFCANKLEDSDTRIALEGALELFDKPVIPVATKADLISIERWDQIRERFDRQFGELLASHNSTQLYLTVAGGPHKALVGAGIQELRSCLAFFAADASEMKLLADSAFLRDESRAVALVLDETAKMLVANLRTIASLGDSLALEAEKEAARGRLAAYSRVDGYLRDLRNDSKLDAAARAIHASTDGGRSGDIEDEVRRSLESFVDRRFVEQCVNEAFADASRSLEAIAQKLSQGADLARLNFRSSGSVARMPISFDLKLDAFELTSKLGFPVRLDHPSGFLENAWDKFKGVLGIDRFSVSDIRAAMIGALSLPAEAMDDCRTQALYNGFAPALKDAVDLALNEHLWATDVRALEQLRQVDSYLPLLDPAGSLPRATTYGPQGEYWATLTPEVETLLDLARAELTRLMPEFRRLLVESFPFALPTRLPSFWRFWKERKLDSKVVAVRIPWHLIYEEALCREPLGPDDALRFKFARFADKLRTAQSDFLASAPLTSGLDERLGRTIVGAMYESAGSRLVQIGSSAFQAAWKCSTRDWVLEEQHHRLGRLSFAKGTFMWAGFVVVAAIGFAIGGMSLPWLGVVLSFLLAGVATPYYRLLRRYKRDMGDAIQAEVARCQEDSLALLLGDVVDAVIAGMSAELAPRPLQRLLADAGRLKTG